MTDGLLLLIIFVTSFAAVALTAHALQQSFDHKRRSGRNIRTAAETGLMPGTEAVAAAAARAKGKPPARRQRLSLPPRAPNAWTIPRRSPPCWPRNASF